MSAAGITDPELRVIADEAMADLRAGRLRRPADVAEQMWWDRRRDGEPSADYLGRVLEEAGLADVAANARAAHYDDYFAPAEVSDGLETLRLVRDLRRARSAVTDAARLERIDAIDLAIRAGEFDGTKAESDRWAASASGQRAFSALTGRPGRNDPCLCGSGLKFKRCCGG